MSASPNVFARISALVENLRFTCLELHIQDDRVLVFAVAKIADFVHFALHVAVMPVENLLALLELGSHVVGVWGSDSLMFLVSKVASKFLCIFEICCNEAALPGSSLLLMVLV